MSLRPDLDIISQWIQPDSQVLDLGCGDGLLLEHLKRTRNVQGYGIEIDSENVLACLDKGIDVIQHHIEKSLSGFDAQSFDYVIMTQTLQSMVEPVPVLEQILRIGKEGIVTFPNFAHFPNRLRLFFSGLMPKSKALPYEWYDTPNIHLCTIRDFEQLCEERAFTILERAVVDTEHHDSPLIRLLPNFFGELAIYRLKSSKEWKATPDPR